MPLVYKKEGKMSSKKTIGKIIKIAGSVVDIRFNEDETPQIYDALHTQNQGKKITLEVEQLLENGIVRCLSMSDTDGLVRGQEVENSGAPISVPARDGRAVFPDREEAAAPLRRTAAVFPIGRERPVPEPAAAPPEPADRSEAVTERRGRVRPHLPCLRKRSRNFTPKAERKKSAANRKKFFSA